MPAVEANLVHSPWLAKTGEMKSRQPPRSQTSRYSGPRGRAVATVRVPAVLQPTPPVAATSTVREPVPPGATSAKSTTGVDSPGASGSETYVEPSTERATWTAEQLPGEEVN